LALGKSSLLTRKEIYYLSNRVKKIEISDGYSLSKALKEFFIQDVTPMIRFVIHPNEHGLLARLRRGTEDFLESNGLD
jgi:hypothetical protein